MLILQGRQANAVEDPDRLFAEIIEAALKAQRKSGMRVIYGKASGRHYLDCHGKPVVIPRVPAVAARHYLLYLAMLFITACENNEEEGIEECGRLAEKCDGAIFNFTFPEMKRL